jgi:hypothetical protein
MKNGYVPSSNQMNLLLFSCKLIRIKEKEDLKKFSFLSIAEVWIRIQIGFRKKKFCIIACEDTRYGINTGTVHTVKLEPTQLHAIFS